MPNQTWLHSCHKLVFQLWHLPRARFFFSRKYLSNGFDLSQILSQSQNLDWRLKLEFRLKYFPELQPWGRCFIKLKRRLCLCWQAYVKTSLFFFKQSPDLIWTGLFSRFSHMAVPYSSVDLSLNCHFLYFRSPEQEASGQISWLLLTWCQF